MYLIKLRKCAARGDSRRLEHWRNSSLTHGETHRSVGPVAVDCRKGSFDKKTCGLGSDHPVEARFLPNLRRAPDRKARLAQEQLSPAPNLLVQGLRRVLFLLGRTERRQISPARHRPSAVPVQPRPFLGRHRAPHRVGAPHYGTAPDHLRLDLWLPINHHLSSASRRSDPTVRPQHA
jgi:hypothetical protein